MSHELRTPLNSIIGFTGILRQGYAGPVNEEQKKQLALVYGSAKHLLSLINDLLDLSRIEAGKVEIERQPFSFAEVIDEVVESLLPLARQKKLELVVDAPRAGLEMLGDRKRCFQVLLNLVGNAVKFTERGEVTVRAARDGGRVRVAVADADRNYATESIQVALARLIPDILPPTLHQHEGLSVIEKEPRIEELPAHRENLIHAGPNVGLRVKRTRRQTVLERWPMREQLSCCT